MSWENPNTMMMRAMEKKRSGQAGFTLVELLVVIVILGVLAGIVVFAVGGINDKGKTSSCKADKSSLETAEEAYYGSHDPGVYGTEAELKSGGFIHDLSTMHDITLVAGTVPSYTVDDVAGKCP